MRCAVIASSPSKHAPSKFSSNQSFVQYMICYVIEQRRNAFEIISQAGEGTIGHYDRRACVFESELLVSNRDSYRNELTFFRRWFGLHDIHHRAFPLADPMLSKTPVDYRELKRDVTLKSCLPDGLSRFQAVLHRKALPGIFIGSFVFGIFRSLSQSSLSFDMRGQLWSEKSKKTQPLATWNVQSSWPYETLIGFGFFATNLLTIFHVMESCGFPRHVIRRIIKYPLSMDHVGTKKPVWEPTVLNFWGLYSSFLRELYM
jgi:hypothetical protein